MRTRTKTKNFFAPRATGLDGAVTRAAMMLAVVMLAMNVQTVQADQSGDWIYSPNVTGTECYIEDYTGSKDVATLTIPTYLGLAKVIGINGINFSEFTNLETLNFGLLSYVQEMPPVTNCSKLVNIKSTSDYTLPASITKIPNNCFQGTKIESLQMPGVTEVGSYAFRGSSKLTDVRFGQAATIGSSAFREISSTCTVRYPGPMSNWNSVGTYMYSPNLIVLGTNADDKVEWFCGWCGGANSDSGNYLYYTTDTEGHMTVKPYWDTYEQSKQVIATCSWIGYNNEDVIRSLTLEHVYAMCDEAFLGCENLKDVTLSDCLASISERAFYNCKAIESLIMPASVTTIGNGAFRQCGRLTVNILASVTSIGDDAFGGCDDLTINFYGTSMPSFGSDVFTHIYYQILKICVFGDCVDAYKSALPDYYASDVEAFTLAVNDAGNGSGKWTTYYNGLADVTVSDGTTIYKAALSSDKSSVTLTQVAGNIVKRGEAVLLNSDDAVTLSSAASSGTGDYSGNDLRGEDQPTATPANCYTLSRGASGTGAIGFYQYSGETVAANKAYIIVANPSLARSFIGFDFGAEPGTTGIGSAVSALGDGEWYTLDGRRLSGKPSAKGIYIHNGRKEAIR